MVLPLLDAGCDVKTNDVDLNHQTDWHFDATDASAWPWRVWPWVITNPPFNQAFDILKVSLEAGNCVAFLLRLSFLEPTFERGMFLAENPPNKILVLPRISFTGDGKTDSVTCAWLIWDQSDESWVRVVPKEEKE